MNARLIVVMMTAATAVLVIAAMATGTLAAQDAPQHGWAGSRIREASLNWADYVAEPAETELPRKTWAGPMIQAASTNWADYHGESPAVSIAERWAGMQIQQASTNWADFGREPLASSDP